MRANLYFTLVDVQGPAWGLEHDHSLSRKDASKGDMVHINRRNLRVFFPQVQKCQKNGTVDTECYRFKSCPERGLEKAKPEEHM